MKVVFFRSADTHVISGFTKEVQAFNFVSMSPENRLLEFTFSDTRRQNTTNPSREEGAVPIQVLA